MLLERKHGIRSLPSLAGVSRQAVAIHLKFSNKPSRNTSKVKTVLNKYKTVPNLMYRHHALIHNMCDSGK